MKSNISITAEFASLIKSESDPRNAYFVSSKTQKIHRILRWVLPKNFLNDIFVWRQHLSEKFDKKIAKEQPGQIIDLGAGYSLRGFNLCVKNSDLVYIDSDFNYVISRKKRIMDSLCEKEGIPFPKNLHFVAIDVLHDSIPVKVGNLLETGKETLIIAEGLISYFSMPELQSFFSQIQNTFTQFPLASFYSSEKFADPKGFLYKIVRKGLAFATQSQKSHQFKDEESFIDFLKDCGITHYKREDFDSGRLMYSITV